LSIYQPAYIALSTPKYQALHKQRLLFIKVPAEKQALVIDGISPILP